MLPTSLGKYKLLRVNEIECLNKYYHSIMRNVRGCGMANIRTIERDRERQRRREGGEGKKGKKRTKEKEGRRKPSKRQIKNSV